MRPVFGARVSESVVTLARLDPAAGATSPQIAQREVGAAAGPVETLAGLLAAVLPEAPETHRLVVDVGPLVDAAILESASGDGIYGPATKSAMGVRRLGRVTVARVAASADTIAPPFTGWPDRLGPAIDGGWIHVPGGADLHGGRVRTTQPDAARDVLALAAKNDAAAVCVSATGALIDIDTECDIAEEVLRSDPSRRIAFAHRAVGLRFFERERSAILGAALALTVEPILDELTALADRTGVLVSLAGADGALVSIEDARDMCVPLVGTHSALVAQGAARIAGTSSALVLLWRADHVRLLTYDDGVLRAAQLRNTARLGLRFGQRHAVEAIVALTSIPAIVQTMSTRDSIVVVRASDSRPGGADPRPSDADSTPGDADFSAFAAAVRKHHPEAAVVEHPADLLAAVGAAAALAQSEILRYVNVANSPDLDRARQRLRAIAQGQVLATAGQPVVLETLADQVAPLSFLKSGPTLVRSHVVGRPTGTTP